jgi:hypothetical protein
MGLERNMNESEILKFIDNELLPQVKKEVSHWIYPKKQTGGYFAVTRQIFCMIDFLGAAYSGYPLQERKLDKNGQKISTSLKAIKFITDFFEPKNIYNHKVVTKLYSMYRHGLVHLYQPRILKLNTRKRLVWFFYRGKRNVSSIKIGTDKGQKIFRNVTHLQILTDTDNKNYKYLVISINCLYEDFEDAIKKYRNKLVNTKYLQKNWRTTVNAILKPRQLKISATLRC